MFRLQKHLSLAFLSGAFFATPQLVMAEDSCKDILEYAARNYLNHFSKEQREAWAYSKKCSTSTKSAGLDIFIEAVNIGTSSAQNSQSCSKNQNINKYQSTIEIIESTVSVPALQNWSSCMDAYSKNLAVKVKRPNEATIQFIIRNGTPYNEELTNVLIQSHEKTGITCSSFNENKPQNLQPARDFLINCTRSYVDVRRGEADYQILPAGSITIVTSISSYSYGFPESFKVDNLLIPQRIVFPLSGIHRWTRAYYSKGRKSRIYECSDRQSPTPDFELVVISTREERVTDFRNRRGRCARPPHCDSSGEYCAEVYYVKACYINKEWHEWYKSDSARRGIPYAKEVVCGA